MSPVPAEGVRIAPELDELISFEGRPRPHEAVAIGPQGIPGRFRTDRLILDTPDIDEARELARELGGDLRLTQRSAAYVNGREIADDVPMLEAPTLTLRAGRYDVPELAERLAAEGVRDLWVNSPEGAAILRAAVAARQRGLPVSLDRLCDLSATPPDAYSDAQGDDRLTLPGFGNGPGQPQITRSWQYLDLVDHGSVKAAVIDHGYRVQSAGVLAPGPGLAGPDLPTIKTMAFNLPYVGAAGAVPGGKGYHGHKSAHILGGLAGNSVGTSGSAAPGVLQELLLMEFDDSMSAFYSCLNYARLSGCHVVNVSAGWTFDSAFDGRWATPGAFFEAFEKAEAARTVVVVSAGNGDNKGSPGYKLPDTFVLPATRCAGTVTVGAYEGALVPKGYSNYGSSVDIWAPTDLEVPDIDAVAGPGGSAAYRTFGGTSCASPLVAGIVATLKSVRSDLSSSEVTGLLRDNGWTNSPDPRVDVAVNAYESLHALLKGDVKPNDSPVGSATAPHRLDLFGVGTGLSTAGAYGRRIRKGDVHSYTLEFAFPLNRLRIWVDYPDRLNGLGVTVTVVSDGQVTSWDATSDAEPDRFFPPGKATIVVRGTAPNGYDLSCQVTQPTIAADAFEPNDTPAQETVIDNASPPVLEGSIHETSDQDRYRVAIVRAKSDIYSMTLETIDGSLRIGSAQLTPADQLCSPGTPLDMSAAERFQIYADTPTRYRITWWLLDGSVKELFTEILRLDELPKIWIDFGNGPDERVLDLPAGVSRFCIRLADGQEASVLIQPERADTPVRLLLPESPTRGEVALSPGPTGRVTAQHVSGLALVEVNASVRCAIRVIRSV